MQYVTVSAKIPRRLQELLDKYRIKPGPIIRRALENDVKKKMLEQVESEVKRLSKKVSHIHDEEIVRLIREDREKTIDVLV